MSYNRNFYENFPKVIAPLSIKIGYFIFIRSLNLNAIKLNLRAIFHYI